MHPLLADPWVAAQIEAAVAPYRKLWPAEAIEAFREEMAITLATHPTAARLLKEARPTALDPSGEVNVAGAWAEAPGAADKAKAGSDK